MEINWAGPLLSFNPDKGINLQDNAPGGVRFPAYGKYGGPQITGNGQTPADSLDGL